MNLLLIGVGRHSKRIHLPHINKYKEQYDLRISGVIDLEQNKQAVMERINSVISPLERQPDYIFLRNEDRSEIKQQIISYIQDNNITSALVSCGPLWHKFYCEILLELNVNIFCDKPISMAKNASNSLSSAKSIFDEYINLLQRYEKSRKNGTLFCCLSQRRCHPAIQYIVDSISEVYRQTGMGVNSVNCHYTDGQWRMPEEIVKEDYHGYKGGIGMCSHSGYHFYDLCHYYLEAMPDFSYDEIVAHSDFSYPADYFCQFPIEKQAAVLPGYSKLYTSTSQAIEKSCYKYGEIDAHSSFQFRKKNKLLSRVNISLMHSGFSSRDWLKSKEDLYKGNGRLRHETHIINQGPLQTIYYQSYQSDQIGNNSLANSDEVGGELHSEVTIFRNPIVTTTGKTEVYTKRFGRNMDHGVKGYSGGHQENARAIAFVEFLDSCTGQKPRDDVKTDFAKQKGANLLLSLSYQAAANQKNGSDPIAYYKSR